MKGRKLIGAIIGVLAFIALVAGATFAWITRNVAITRGSYQTDTLNFIVDYNKGSNVDDLVELANPGPNTTGIKVVSITAGKGGSKLPGNLTITLNTTSVSNKITQDGYIKYGYCIGTCTNNNFAGTGSVTGTAPINIITNTPLQDPAIVYNIYFWYDGTMNSETYAGLAYQGNITASATQTEP